MKPSPDFFPRIGLPARSPRRRDLVDYISFIANENVAFFDLVDYISFIALGVYSVGVYSVGVYYLGQPIWDLN